MKNNLPKSFQWNEGEDKDIFDMLITQKKDTSLIHACRNTINARYRLLYKRTNANIEFPSLSIEHVGAIVKNIICSPPPYLQSLAVNGIVTEIQFRVEHNQPETDNYGSDIVFPFPYQFPPSSPLFQKCFHIRGMLFYKIDLPSDLKKMKRNLLEKGPLLGVFYVHPNYDGYDHREVFRVPKPEDTMITHVVMITGYRYDDDQLIWRFQNSRGPNWGNNGYGEIIHDYMKNVYGPIVELDEDEVQVCKGLVTTSEVGELRVKSSS